MTTWEDTARFSHWPWRDREEGARYGTHAGWEASERAQQRWDDWTVRRRDDRPACDGCGRVLSDRDCPCVDPAQHRWAILEPDGTVSGAIVSHDREPVEAVADEYEGRFGPLSVVRVHADDLGLCDCGDCGS